MYVNYNSNIIEHVCPYNYKTGKSYNTKIKKIMNLFLAYRKLFKYADVTKLAVVGPDEPTL